MLDEILLTGKSQDLPAYELAQRAGVTPETLSRIKKRGHGDWAVLNRMAKTVGKRLTLVPDDSTIVALRRGEFFETK
ncbi:MAG: hypothetical protein A2Z44_07445 [Betaproteobacteria bacterium RBG_19FT_COMBO_58_11]|nr:MAG: hypothetical protein A2Z44_07445 [Betaproteobacteria bacterium RBG_19FT_COMBO_58_11]